MPGERLRLELVAVVRRPLMRTWAESGREVVAKMPVGDNSRRRKSGR